MSLLAYHPNPTDTGHLVLAAGLAALGCFLLLPKPRGRSVSGGIAALLIGAAVAGVWILHTFGEPAGDWVGTALFSLFSFGAIGFGSVLVVQRNPARGAIAFAFVILSTCGLFLLLAAPFLMAATIIIYAGAIVVTFLFVLMLSASGGHSDENDRSREPLLGSLAGFAFVGLILFTLQQTHESIAPSTSSDSKDWKKLAPLPTPVITPSEKQALAQAAEELKQLESDEFYSLSNQERAAILLRIEELLDEKTVGLLSAKIEGSTKYGSIHPRLAGYRTDRQADAVLKQAEAIRKDGARTLAKVDLAKQLGNVDEAKAEVRQLREQVLLLAGAGELPARNTANLGLLLYSEHLLAIELAGTLLLVATIGAIAIAHRKAVAA